MENTEILIVGSGPAGLMAAYKAAIKGHSITILEKQDRPGGMSASFEISGMRVDYGSHRLHPATPPHLLNDLKDMMGNDLQVRNRNGRIRVEDRWVAFPLRFSDLIKSLPTKTVLNFTMDALTSPFRRPQNETFADYIKAGLGPHVFELIYGPFSQKLWGMPANKLHSDLANRRVSSNSPIDILKKLLRSTLPSGRTFFYPRNGYGQISERLAEESQKLGVDIRFETEIESVKLLENDSVITKTQNHSFESQRIWSTAPFSALTKILDPSPSPETLSSIQELKYRAMVLVYLICDQNQFTEFDAHYLPGIDSPMSRISEPKNYREGPDPKDITILCCEVPCWEGDEIWESSDSDLGERMLNSLAEQGLPAVKLLETQTRRIPKVYPIYGLDYKNKFENLIDWTTSQKQLTIFGRQGLFAPDNLHHALAMGDAAAKALGSDCSFNGDSWKASLEAFQTHVVED